MAKESVLTLLEKQSIKIEHFIFHIIIQDDNSPHYLDEVVISDEQKNFFRERLISVSEGIQLLFLDKAHNATYISANKIIDNVNQNFLESSKDLTASFKSRHNKNTSDGVFITSLVSIENSRKLIFLVKLDHKKVYEYKLKGTKALLTEIKNTFIEDKSAVQKVALIDVSDYYAWDVLAYDRAKPGDLTDYFKLFLGVAFLATPKSWTLKAIKFVNEWATANKSIIDPNQEASKYKSRAISYLLSTDLFNHEDYITSVIYDEDDNRRKKLKKSLADFIAEKGLSGQSFKPSKSAITSSVKKNRVQTREGVKIEWTGAADESNIVIPNEKNTQDGLYHIIIKTDNITNL